MISILSSTLASTTDGYTYAWEPLDGNMSKVRPVDLTIDFGYPEQLGARWFRYGRWISREHLPTRWRATYGDKPMPRTRLDPPDIGFNHLADIVSQRFRDIVERFEPGIHQFEPFPIVHANGEKDERPFYLMIAGQRVVISPDQTRTRPPMREFPERPELVKRSRQAPAFFQLRQLQKRMGAGLPARSGRGAAPVLRGGFPELSFRFRRPAEGAGGGRHGGSDVPRTLPGDGRGPDARGPAAMGVTQATGSRR
jgi:hypothetical protein